jgi:hypothetical protein
MSVATVGPVTAPTTAPAGPATEPPATAPLNLSLDVEQAARLSAATPRRAIFSVDIHMLQFPILS